MKTIRRIAPVLAIMLIACVSFGCKKNADKTEDFPKQTKVDPNQARYKALHDEATKARDNALANPQQTDEAASTEEANQTVANEQQANTQASTKQNDPNSLVIMIDKATMKLRVINETGKVVAEYPVACGKNYGQKKRTGDEKTPEGNFHITSIEKADTWAFDFKDGKGPITGAYGPWFFRLATPGFSGVGIHGTHDPSTIGTRDTHGCIRLKNSDLTDLKKYVYVGMPVTITPSQADINADNGVKQ